MKKQPLQLHWQGFVEKMKWNYAGSVIHCEARFDNGDKVPMIRYVHLCPHELKMVCGWSD